MLKLHILIMQGCYIYRDESDEPNILAYRETEFSRVFVVKYNNNQLLAGFVNLKKFVKEFPKNGIHILEKLPYNDDLITLLETWHKIILQKLSNL